MLPVRLYVTNFYKKNTFQKHCSLRNLSCISSILDCKKTQKAKKEAKCEQKKIGGGEVHEKMCRSKFMDCDLFDSSSEVIVGIIGGGMESAYTTILLKQSSLVKYVNLVDLKDTLKGAILDINHIDTAPKVRHYHRKQIKEALQDVNVIALMDDIIPDVIKNSNNSSKLNTVCKYVRDIIEITIEHCPTALVAVMMRPVTAMLPMISEIYRSAGQWDPNKLIGSISIESMRMEATTANLLDLNPAFLAVPMVAGADSNTVVPLLSCAKPTNHFTSEQREFLLNCLRMADREIATTEAKVPTLSTGVAAAKFILTLVGGLSGFKNVIACAYVHSNVLPGCRFFTTELQFGPGGVQKNFGLPKVSSTEISLIEEAVPFINEQIEMGVRAIYT